MDMVISIFYYYMDMSNFQLEFGVELKIHTQQYLLPPNTITLARLPCREILDTSVISSKLTSRDSLFNSETVLYPSLYFVSSFLDPTEEDNVTD